SDGSQQYVVFHMAKDVSLSDVEAALKGSGFTVPRDKLRLFGHVILEVDAHAAPHDKLAADLGTIKGAVVDKSELKDGLLNVTLEMPYPSSRGNSGQTRKVGWASFDRQDFGPESMKSESAVTAQGLPTYSAVQKALAKDDATLKDVRWSTVYSC